VRVEEYDDAGTLVVRAELPEIDLDKDVELSILEIRVPVAAAEEKPPVTKVPISRG
jgi:HSP20 family molecular chaperone IbpA